MTLVQLSERRNKLNLEFGGRQVPALVMPLTDRTDENFSQDKTYSPRLWQPVDFAV